MPGVAGVVNNVNITESQFEVALDSLKYTDFHKREETRSLSNVVMGAVVNQDFRKAYSLHESEDLIVEVYGEIYSIEGSSALANDFDSSTYLANAYAQGELKNNLALVNGYFSVVIVDRQKGKITLAVDRLSMKPLYYYHQGKQFAWSTEVKFFTLLPQLDQKFWEGALGCFVEMGQFLGNDTWFENIKLVGPSDIVEFDLNSGGLDKDKYWGWNKVKPLDVSFDQAVEGMVENLSGAFERICSFDTDRVGISLSGGLDSRLILAQMEGYDPVETFTFGLDSSQDMSIAQQTSEIAGFKHNVMSLNRDSWLRGRVLGVWKTDGMFNMLHMHSSPFHPQMKDICDVNVNGFAGDLYMGGSYLKPSSIGKRSDAEWAQKIYGKWASRDDVNSSFYDINSLDPHFINNRVRRFTNAGTTELVKWVEQRKPYNDNLLLEFCYGLPEKYRMYGEVYHKALLQMHPKYYNEIPWQSTGRPITWRPTFWYKMSKYKIMLANKLRIPLKRETFVNYADWFRDSKGASLIEELFINSDPIMSDLGGSAYIEKYVKPYREGENQVYEHLGRLISAEIWLRRIEGRELKLDL